VLKNDGRKMEFQRYIKLINGTWSNDSFTKKL